MLLSCTCPCWRVLRETRGPPLIQVAMISLPSLTLLAPSALGGVDRDRGGKEEPEWSCASPCVFQGAS